jgi:predicted RNA binding protein YcfA (HicA-like mRNA interferase family)
VSKKLSLPSVELRKFAREVGAEGWAWEFCRGGHVRFTHPRASGVVIAASTSGDNNQCRILRQHMRRALSA